MVKRSLIFCEVTCGKCGCMSTLSGYYSPERIIRLLQDTKDWKLDGTFGNLCPECQKEMQKSNK